MTSFTIPAASPRVLPVPPPSRRAPPAASFRTLPDPSRLASSAGRCQPPREATEARVSHCAELSPRLRRRGGSSPYRRPSGATMSAVELQPSLALKTKAVEVAQTLKGTSIFLVGMNNTVKASIGKTLADALRYYYFDSDGLVEEAAGGESAARAFRERDESGFRESEHQGNFLQSEVLKQLTSMGRLVVCAGDGAVQNATNLGYLRYGISIWVDVPLDIIADEVLNSGTQSLNAQDRSTSDPFDEVLTQLTSQYEENKEGCGTADATVSLLKVASTLGYDDLSCVTPEDMAIEVLKEIEKLTRVKKMMEDAARPF
ncbi:hypothetical protein Taro_014837 [Colocasia esculenta]|uniref:Inactive shikimate kinase like 1, chloroplastic n=1 Tax=Colocasia esculenta TaxID=4460 RepID=A0A843UKJ8_COLES|nr:hypothetical protein [Colocasia esculenta]